MKTKKIAGLILTGAVLLLAAQAGWKANDASDRSSAVVNHSPSDAGELRGNSEYFFQPSGDTRTWHVIERYSLPQENDTLDCNNSEYLTTKDSVLIINDYVGTNSGHNSEFGTLAYLK